MSLSFGSRRRALQHPPRLPCLTPIRALAFLPPPRHASSIGARHVTTAAAAARHASRCVTLAIFGHPSCLRVGAVAVSSLKLLGKNQRFSPPRPFAGPRRPCRTSCLTRQTNPRVLTRPQNKNTQKQPRLGSVRARGARRRRAVGPRTDRVRAGRRAADRGPGFDHHARRRGRRGGARDGRLHHRGLHRCRAEGPGRRRRGG